MYTCTHALMSCFQGLEKLWVNLDAAELTWSAASLRQQISFLYGT